MASLLGCTSLETTVVGVNLLNDSDCDLRKGLGGREGRSLRCNDLDSSKLIA